MKRYGLFLLIIFVLAVASCKSAPPSEEEAGGPETAVLPDSGGAVPAEIPLEDADLSAAGDSSADMPPEDAEDAPPADILAEPEPELAETDRAVFPPEEAFFPALPEPDAANLIPPAEPAAEAPGETPPPEPLPPEPVEVPAERSAVPPDYPPVEVPPPPSLAPPRPLEEASPPPLRPAEVESPVPGIVREPVPLPVPPVREPEISPIAPPPVLPEEDLVFSRIVRATVGQLVEIPFRGTGWVFLGELGGRRGISYDSRRLDPEGQSFVFRAEAAGTYALKFYKQDFIRDYILNDHVQVIVGEAPETSSAGWFNPPLDRGRVSAERWPNAFEEAEALERSRAGSSASGQSVSPADAAPPESTEPGPPAVQPPGVQPAEAGTATAPPSPAGSGDEGIVPVRPPSVAGTAGQEPLPPESAAGAGGQSFLPEESLPEDYLRRAQEEFNAGRVAGALAVLDQFRNRFPSGSDEAWWLYGQFYEANSPSRNIRTALEYYRRLVREYPQSRRYNDARRRIAYLERYYINIQ